MGTARASPTYQREPRAYSSQSEGRSHAVLQYAPTPHQRPEARSMSSGQRPALPADPLVSPSKQSEGTVGWAKPARSEASAGPGFAELRRVGRTGHVARHYAARSAAVGQQGPQRVLVIINAASTRDVAWRGPDWCGAGWRFHTRAGLLITTGSAARSDSATACHAVLWPAPTRVACPRSTCRVLPDVATKTLFFVAASMFLFLLARRPGACWHCWPTTSRAVTAPRAAAAPAGRCRAAPTGRPGRGPR